MYKCYSIFAGLLLFFSVSAFAQDDDSVFIRRQITNLCNDSFSGRGYVNNGVNKAADYISQQFRLIGLKPADGDGYFQKFTFSVNTFPGTMLLRYKGRKRKAGVDYLIDGSSQGIQRRKYRTQIVSLDSVSTRYQWDSLLQGTNDKHKAYVLLHVDTLQKRLGLSPRAIAGSLPQGLFIFPKKAKPLWWPATDTNKATIVYWFDTSRDIRNNKRICLDIAQQFNPEMQCSNIAGLIQGSADSFLVITAHYDHLGKMGKEAVFPGASDNASGTAMLLSLAKYFKQHPQRYNILFIAFAGEEAGLLGSEYFVNHPLIDLSKIHQLINIDIMGDASDGIAVVNATENEKTYDLLKGLNPVKKMHGSDTTYVLKEIRKRDNAPNSDHYPFSKAGVPAVFIYSLGGKGYYHDTWDKPAALSLKNVTTVRTMLIELIKQLQ